MAEQQKPNGLVLFGGVLDGREINSTRELETANVRVHGEGRYQQTERRSRDGRLVFAFQQHERSES